MSFFELLGKFIGRLIQLDVESPFPIEPVPVTVSAVFPIRWRGEEVCCVSERFKTVDLGTIFDCHLIPAVPLQQLLDHKGKGNCGEDQMFEGIPDHRLLGVQS